MEWLKTILEDEKIENKIDAIKKELPLHFIPKEKYNEKTAEIQEKIDELKTTKDKMQELQTQVEKLSQEGGEQEKLKEKLENINNEFEKFKSESESRLANVKKTQAIEKGLRDAQANPDTIDLLITKFDLEKIELAEDGKVKDWDNYLNPLKETRKSLFAETNISGNKPPDGNSTEPSGYKAKYEAALKTGDRLGAIKIKQEAFKEGEIL